MERDELKDKIEFSNFLNQVRSKWRWFLLFGIVGVGIGFFAAKYMKDIYVANATIKIQDGQSATSEFLSIDLFSETFNQYNKVLTESKIISSRTIIERSLNELPLDIRYYKKGMFSSYELYRKSPISLNILSDVNEKEPLELNLKFQDTSRFTVSYFLDKVENKLDLTFDEPFTINDITFSFTSSNGAQTKSIETDGSYVIRIVDKQRLAQEFAKSLTVNEIAEKVSILKISYQSTNALLCKEFVESLVKTYEEYQLEQKSKAASNTIKFIDERLSQISTTMLEVEDKITQFKEEKQIIDFEAVERLETEKIVDLESNKRIAELRLLNIQTVENELNQGKKLTEISINAEGNLDPTLNQLISFFNELKIQKSTLGINFTGESKKSREINSQLIETINAIRKSIKLSKASVQNEISFLQEKIDNLNKRFSVFPENQKNYFHLIRDFEVNQKVVSFLMEKKIEASIANASIIPDVQIIDFPILPEEPISISDLNIYLASILLTLLIGTSGILLIVFFNNRIYDKATLENATDIPVMGILTVSDSEEFQSHIEVVGSERTIFKESVNALRTNIRFLPTTKSARIISVTSTVSQEGKSFTLVNLAASLTLLNKKVIIVDLDMRKPKVHKYFNGINTKFGASTYLAKKSSLEEVINESVIENLDVIYSGPIPPNPMELIQSDNFIEMIEVLKSKYDYIMLDNPPIGIVSDAINVMSMSDLNLFVVRAGYSQIQFLDTAVNVKQKNQIDNLYFVLNGSKKSGSGYYKTYSQGYYTDGPKKKFKLL